MTAINDLVDWAVELQSLAQAGLHYTHDDFDKERFSRIREISAQMMEQATGVPLPKVQSLFCGETGYQTPKIDTRAAIFKDEKILLVRERDGRWAIPGGWCEVNLSPAQNTIKEAREEAGLGVSVDSLIAVQDRALHNEPQRAWGICKIFFMCHVVDEMDFVKNIETSERGYFAQGSLPPLASEKCNASQVTMCFEAYRQGNSWKVLFD